MAVSLRARDEEGLWAKRGYGHSHGPSIGQGQDQYTVAQPCKTGDQEASAQGQICEIHMFRVDFAFSFPLVA